jgi:hypothetical protein
VSRDSRRTAANMGKLPERLRRLTEPWDTLAHVAEDIGYTVGVMILMAIFTSIIRFLFLAERSANA